MKPLETQFQKDGFTFTQRYRDGEWAIYQQAKKDSKLIRYELVRIRVRPAQILYGREYPEREVYPSSERWGVDGWTFLSLKEALRKLSAQQGH